MSQFFASGGQSIGASASASVLPMNIQGWFPLGLTVGSPCSPKDAQESSPTPQFKSINSSEEATCVHQQTHEENVLHTYSNCLVTKLCLTLCDPMDCSLPCSSVHGISQARILEWVAISFPRVCLPDPCVEPVSCLLHWQVESLSLSNLRSPYTQP